jgi:hypothetical protein
MKASKFFSYYFLLLFSLSVDATDDFPKFGGGAQPVKRLKATETPLYGSPEPIIKNEILFNKKNRRTNHFCVVGYAMLDGSMFFWVHWSEEKRLIAWYDENEHGFPSQGEIILGKDTVEKPEDVGTSTYLVTRAWWESVSGDCAKYGEKFTIKPFTKKIKKNV